MSLLKFEKMENKLLSKKLVNAAPEPLKLIGRISEFLFWAPYYNNNNNDKKLILIKTDINFKLIWRKEVVGLGFWYKIEAAIANSNDILAFGEIEEPGDPYPSLLIVKLNNLGNPIWRKKYDVDLTVTNIFETIPEDISVYSHTPTQHYFIGIYDQLLLLDLGGNILVNKQIKSRPSKKFIIRGIKYLDNKIFVLGNTSEFSGLGELLVIDTALNIISDHIFKSTYSFSRNSSANESMVVLGTDLIISGRYNIGEGSIFITRINPTTQNALTSIRIPNDFDRPIYPSTANNCLYFNYWRGPVNLTDFFKFNFDLSIAWSKQIWSPIRNFCFKAFDDFLYYSISQKFSTSQTVENTLYKTDQDLFSDCSTFVDFNETIELSNVTRIVGSAFTENNAIAVSAIILEINDLDGFQIHQICPQTYDLEESLISANPTSINGDGSSTSLITAQLKDYLGNNLTDGGETLVITTSVGSIGATIDDGQGSYTATLTAPNSPGTATLSFTVNGEQASDTAEVIFEEVVPQIAQSPHLYLQSAGSTGSDGSVPGIHLRWLLKNDLIHHLPKGDLATTTVNFNRPDDVVKVYRAPYTAVPTTLDLARPPQAIASREALWVYQVDGHTFQLYFRDKAQYATVRNTVDPMQQPLAFIQAYGDHIMELQSRELFFAVSIAVNTTATGTQVRTEVLSVEDNARQAAQKYITARKTFTASGLANARSVAENGKSVRLQATNCNVTQITIELYSVFNDAVENGAGWTELGQFGLTLDDTEAFSRLEPTTDSINGQWPRYNQGDLVNIQNYKDKWNGTDPELMGTIRDTVNDYVTLSDDADDPTALETFNFSETLPEGATSEKDTFEISNLMLLQQASMDFHVARMLGLGHLDTDPTGNEVFVYLAVYDTLMPENTEHRYMTIPTSRSDERLPLPVDLKAPKPGLFTTQGIGEDAPPLTDAQGYTQDGKTRFVTLYAEEPQDLTKDTGFYIPTTEFNLSETTAPVYTGIEYKKQGETNWRRPELASTARFKNEVASGSPTDETLPLPIPEEGTPLFVHREREDGEHIYGSYGINWFSRATPSTTVHNLTTTIQPANPLLPPVDRYALLIREEPALVLTTANEQQLLAAITGTDKTLIRLQFNYAQQELISYSVTAEANDPTFELLDANTIFPDAQEVFADWVEIYFRNSMPANIRGKATNVANDPNNELLSIITSGSYTLESTGDDPGNRQKITPVLVGPASNYVGGVLVLEEKEYIIHSLAETNGTLRFTVYKKQLSERLQEGVEPNPSEGLASPVIRGDGMFMAVENMRNTGSWGAPNPNPLKVQIGDNWSVHREVIDRIGPEGDIEKVLQKTRGLWGDATIEKVLRPKTIVYDPVTDEPTVTEEEHKGQYKVTFNTVQLGDHPQNGGGNPVEWHGGMLRIHTTNDPNGERRTFEVFKIENVGSGTSLIVYFTDNGFKDDAAYDPVQLGADVSVNYYPGYRIYLHADPTNGISSDTLLPEAGEGIKYSCFGFRSAATSEGYYSKISVPVPMFAQEERIPLVPELPTGALYATRPDSFGKATYTLVTQFGHEPHGILYYRASDNDILNALYIPTTVAAIKTALKTSDPDFLPNRWQNLLGFDYNYPANSFQTNGLFAIYPETGEGYRLPNPDNPALFVENGEGPGTVTPGNLINEIRTAATNAFVPLTEVPLLYKYIRTNADYEPTNKKQKLRDANGALLPPAMPGTSDFDIAPMAKRMEGNTVKFTDFTLDGTSDNLYFYAVRELGNTMQMSPFSPIKGPIKLVNTNPPEAPAIKAAVPILANDLLGIPPQIRIDINAYPEIEGITKLSLYRSLDSQQALSVRNMTMAMELDLGADGQVNDNIWSITDEFGDLPEVPFGDPLYYRLMAYRKIEYANGNDPNAILTDFVPSKPSKLLVTAIVENTVPDAPNLSYTAATGTNGLTNVVLQWDKTVYKGTYYLYKMNTQGQWIKIFEMASNDDSISVPLQDTDWGTDILPDENEDGEAIYHHFKVIAANTANVLSRENNILTVPQSN